MGRGQSQSLMVLCFENEGAFTTGFTFGDSRRDSYWNILPPPFSRTAGLNHARS